MTLTRQPFEGLPGGEDKRRQRVRELFSTRTHLHGMNPSVTPSAETPKELGRTFEIYAKAFPAHASGVATRSSH